MREVGSAHYYLLIALCTISSWLYSTHSTDCLVSAAHEVLQALVTVGPRGIPPMSSELVTNKLSEKEPAVHLKNNSVTAPARITDGRHEQGVKVECQVKCEDR